MDKEDELKGWTIDCTSTGKDGGVIKDPNSRLSLREEPVTIKEENAGQTN